MRGYLGQFSGLRATLYLELLPREWFPINNPFLSSESYTLGLTAQITAEGIEAARFRVEEEQQPRKGAKQR